MTKRILPKSNAIMGQHSVIKKIPDFIVISLWILGSVVWVLSVFTSIEITSKTINMICLISAISGTIYLIITFIPFKKPKNLSLIIMIISLFGASVVMSKYGWNGDFKTQTTLYKHGHLKGKTIEIQVRDKGALGYDMRIVEVTKLTGYLRLVEPADTSHISLPWIKVEKTNK